MATAAAVNQLPPLRQKQNAESSVASPAQQQRASQVAKRKQRKPRKRAFLVMGVSQNDKIFFIDNLATMLTAGLSLSLALKTLAVETKKKTMRNAMLSIEHVIDQGRLFSEGLAEHPEVFPQLFIAVVKVGEAGGTLSEVLTRLAEIAKKEKALRSKVISALIYPSIVVLAMIGITIVLMVYVFPQLIAIFEEVGVTLPIQTKILIAIFRFFESYWLYIVAALLVILGGLFFARNERPLRKIMHSIILHVPFMGTISRELALTRILGNLKMLMISGVPIVQAFTIASRTSGNVVYEDELIRVAKKIELGNPLHEVLGQRPKLFPPLLITMAKVGEETGKLDEILGKLETFYGNRVENIFANLSTIIEPVLLITIGIMVGFIAVSVIMPIYNLAQAF